MFEDSPRSSTSMFLSSYGESEVCGEPTEPTLKEKKDVDTEEMIVKTLVLKVSKNQQKLSQNVTIVFCPHEYSDRDNFRSSLTAGWKRTCDHPHAKPACMHFTTLTAVKALGVLSIYTRDCRHSKRLSARIFTPR